MIDRLTGLPNLVGFLDWINSLSNQDFSFPCSLLAFQFPALWQVNRSQGRAAGNELLKWCAQTLKARHPGPLFRAGGDKFALLLTETGPSQNLTQVCRLVEALPFEKMTPPLPAARAALIHFSNKREFTPGNVLACLFVSLADGYHTTAGGEPVEFHADRIQAMEAYPWMMLDLADQMMRVGVTADEFLHLAETDSVSQLPNLRAAMSKLEATLQNAQERGEPLSVLMIDGDNLRKYNQVSYAAGDEAIRLIGATLQQHLRETDFLARYRAGDEFLVLLLNTPLKRALYIGQRLCWAVERASQAWLFHTTISMGVAVFPQHGQTIPDLLLVAECGLDMAKQKGKNQAAVCETRAVKKIISDAAKPKGTLSTGPIGTSSMWFDSTTTYST